MRQSAWDECGAFPASCMARTTQHQGLAAGGLCRFRFGRGKVCKVHHGQTACVAHSELWAHPPHWQVGCSPSDVVQLLVGRWDI